MITILCIVLAVDPRLMRQIHALAEARRMNVGQLVLSLLRQEIRLGSLRNPYLAGPALVQPGAVHVPTTLERLN